MWIADQWKDYEVIDCSKGEKLEREIKSYQTKISKERTLFNFG